MTNHFSNLGTLLGRLVPRCTDPHLPVRQTAIDCVQVVLRIALRYQGETRSIFGYVSYISILLDCVKVWFIMGNTPTSSHLCV